MIDFRLPCGGGLDVLVDPTPDRAACAAALERLDQREEARLALPAPSSLAERRYVPQLRLLLLGEGPELAATAHLATAAGMAVECHDRTGGGLALGQPPHHLHADRWTAIVLLFHDHEWERAILGWALTTPAFLIGAQGGAPARAAREAALAGLGFAPQQVARIASPIGPVRHSREPLALALSALAGIAGEYERRHPHHAR
jgi:xanthine dehydrogenase accessory factor